MNAFRCLRLAARPANTSIPLRPTLGHLMSRTSQKPIATRNLSLLAPRRPILPSTTFAPTTSLPAPSCTLDSTGAMLDLVPQSSISAHPGFGSIQIRCGPRDTYNPSHLVRKRRHGFLARLKSKKGRKLLMRRIKKGRWNLSH